MAEVNDSKYKMFWVGNDKGMVGARMLLAKKWVEALSHVKCDSDRIMFIKLVVGKRIVIVLSIYAP